MHGERQMNRASLESERLRVVLATVVINIVAVSLLAFAPWSDWRTGLALNAIDNALLVGFAVIRRDGFMARLILFGLAVGFAELVADAWLVQSTRTLDYSIGGGPMLWCSPLWMPLAWEVVAVQFGYIGLRLSERFGARGLLLVALLGAINIVLRGDGETDPLVEIPGLPHDFSHAVLHYPGGIRDCFDAGYSGSAAPAARMGSSGFCRSDWRGRDISLLCNRV